MSTITDHFTAVQQALALIDPTQVMSIANLIRECQGRGGTIWLIGNGGSAATASHFACDLQKAAQVRAIALTDNMPLVTAWANDSEFGDIFVEQFRQLRREGDMVVIISCSGVSGDILAMIRFCMGYHDIATMYGFGRGLGDNSINGYKHASVFMESHDYPVIEDCHLSICHAITKELASG